MEQNEPFKVNNCPAKGKPRIAIVIVYKAFEL